MGSHMSMFTSELPLSFPRTRGPGHIPLDQSVRSANLPGKRSPCRAVRAPVLVVFFSKHHVKDCRGWGYCSAACPLLWILISPHVWEADEPSDVSSLQCSTRHAWYALVYLRSWPVGVTMRQSWYTCRAQRRIWFIETTITACY